MMGEKDKYIENLEKAYREDVDRLMAEIDRLRAERDELEAELKDVRTTKPLRKLRHV